MQHLVARRILGPVIPIVRRHVLWAGLGLGGLFLVLLCTCPYGAGTSPDAVNYLSAARSLLAGRGYRCLDGGVFTHWPPLYPTLLALCGLVGVDPLQGAPLLNGLTLGLIIWLSARLFQQCTTSKAFALVGVLAVALSGPLLDVSTMMWSEPAFVLLTLWFLLSATVFQRTGSTASLLSTSMAAGLSCLQRYAGVAVVLAGVILITWGAPRAPLWRRLRRLACFGLISLGPLAAWLIRNRLHTGQTAGAHHFALTSLHGLGRAIVAVLNTLSEGFVPGSGYLQTKDVFHYHLTGFVRGLGTGSWSSPIRLIGMGVVLLLVVVALSRSRRQQGGAEPAGVTPIGPAAVVTLTYLGFLVAYSMGVSWDPFTYRHLVPVYVPIVLLAVTGLEDIFEFLGRRLAHVTAGKSVGLSLCVLWLLYPLDHACSHLRACRLSGAGGYSTPQWKHSPLMAWLREHPPEGRLYSNGPDAVYLLTGAPATLTPTPAWDPADFVRRELAAQTSYVIWLDTVQWSILIVHDLRELLSRYQMQEIAAFPEGRVYRFLGKGGLPVASVYRFWSTQTGRHFYTINKAERDKLIGRNDGVWAYEGPAFYAIAPDGEKPQNVLPVYRFWSTNLQTHFYTMDEAEKDRLLRQSTGAWTCEGVAFYAWPTADGKDLLPIYRFWSERLSCHFYTVSEQERAKLVREFPDTWTEEEIAWYAYGP